MQTELTIDEVGVRRVYNVQSTSDGTWYKIELNKREDGWKWQVLDGQTGERLGSFPIDIHAWADAEVARLNKA